MAGPGQDEDCVRYWLYPAGDSSAACSTTALARVCSLASRYTQHWVWHGQQFGLRVEHGEGDQWWLTGSTRFGESVADEWFIVSLLVEITRAETGLVGRVVDTDGEILLIEAADALPSWAGEPSLAEGRVFLYRGEVHLLPVCSSPAEISPIPAVTPPPATAVRAVASYPSLSRAAPEVQAAVRARLGGLPGEVGEYHHTTTVLLPTVVADVLANQPSLMPRLVRASADRDLLDVRASRAMAKVRPLPATRHAVTFSRCLYAMLSSCEARPTRASGWQVDMNCKEQRLGWQLALGLEILLCRARDREAGQPRGEDWNKFKAKLESVGFFQGELAGSVRHKQLVESARQFWVASQLEEEVEDVREVVRKAEETPGPLVGSIISSPGRVDSEDWLDITPDSLDRMLEQQFGPGRGRSTDIPTEVDNFLHRMSDMAGVETGEEADKFDPGNLAETMEKLMREMGEESSGDESGVESDEDPMMADYMSQLDDEMAASSAQDRRDMQDPAVACRENLLASFAAQAGLPGPASSLLSSLRINPGRPAES